jgi:predicted cation transporter
VLQILNGIITNIGFSGGINISLNDFSRYNIAAGLHMAMIIMICMEVLKAAVFFAGTHYLLKNKLNLE